MATLHDNALTTLSAIKDELGLTTSGEDDYLIRQINRYSSLLAEATDRKWERVDGYTESIVSVGDTRLQVNARLPLLSVDSVTVDGETVDTSDYEIEDGEAGWIRMIDGAWASTGVARWRAEPYVKYHELDVEVVYDGGYVTPKQVDDGVFSERTLPPSVEGAVMDTVVNKFRRRGAHSGISSESIGGASVAYKNAGHHTDTVLGAQVSASFAGVVERYRDRSVL